MSTLPTSIKPDVQTSFAVAQTIRKTRRVFLGCCKGPQSDKGVTYAPKSIVDMIALATFCVAGFAMITTGAALIDITGGFLLAFAPYISFQKRIISDLGTFRELHNSLREKVNELMLENNQLTKNIDRLEGSVTELEKVEKELAKIANTSDVDRLVYIVQENKKINEKMKKNTQAKIVQQLITTVLRTDRDLDLKIGPVELQNLMIRLDHSPGFDFHKDRFLKLLNKHKKDDNEPVPIEKIMAVIRNLKDENVPESENVFTLRPDTLKKKGIMKR